MNAEKIKKALSSTRGRAFFGLFTGLINGLFASGGGLIAVPALKAQGLNQQKAQATALGFILPLSVLSAVGYVIGTGFPAGWFPTAAGATAGGLAGAWLLGKINNVWLNRIFCALMFYAGVRMLF
ncbi:MAG: TSUP family transporter [Christensenellales bacterium]|jgi:uncharacterized membrane protein YfcA